MVRKKLVLMLALVLALTLAVAACGGGDEGAAPAPPAETPPAEEPPAEEPPAEEPPAEEPPAEGAAPGGTYRLEWEASFNFNSGFDPTGEYLGEAWSIYSSLLVRTLVGYRHVTGPAGNELIPDLATDLGTVSDDGLTYTFTLKDGIKFGPPLSREITSADIAFAFERIATPGLALYGLYYSPIQGMAEFSEGTADSISGIETPDDKTVIFHLTEPTGDFPFRLAMPATGPMPEEVAGCFTESGVYGGYIVSSGPYMIEGSDAQDATSCDTLKPLSGLDPNSFLVVVRNPDYDPATDTTEARENLPDSFEWRINTNNDDIYERVKAGVIDDEIATETPKVLKEYSEDEELKPRFHSDPGDRTWYITMNLTQPPFDDIHVRKAVNLVLNKQALRLAWGGAIAGEIATHIVPDTLFNDKTKGYDPYATPNSEGDVALAMEEMKQSKYDTDGDGLCDADECKGLLHITGDAASRVQMIPVIEDGLSKIGITVKSRSNANAYTIIQTVNKNIPISGQPGWGKDYADAFTFFFYLFNGAGIIPEGNTNYSLVGLTPEQAADVGASGTIDGIPSVDADIIACGKLSGTEREDCFIELDKKLMEDVVPWVPYLWSNAQHISGPAVTQWGFDQFSGSIAYAHVAVDPSKQQ